MDVQGLDRPSAQTQGLATAHGPGLDQSWGAYHIGMVVKIGDDAGEMRTIVGFGSLVLDAPLSHSYPVGTVVYVYAAETLSKVTARNDGKDVGLGQHKDKGLDQHKDKGSKKGTHALAGSRDSPITTPAASATASASATATDVPIVEDKNVTGRPEARTPSGQGVGTGIEIGTPLREEKERGKELDKAMVVHHDDPIFDAERAAFDSKVSSLKAMVDNQAHSLLTLCSFADALREKRAGK